MRTGSHPYTPELFRLLRKFAWLFMATVLLSLSQLAVAVESTAAPNTLRIAYVEFPPYTYQDGEGNPAGVFIEVTRKVVKEAGYQPEFVYLPISRTYLYLINGKIDVWVGVTHVPRLFGEVLESGITPVPVQLSAWYRSDTPVLENFEQLRGKTVIVMAGYTYGGLIDWLNAADDIDITEAPNHRSAIDMLKRKRGDYLLDYQEPVRQILTQPSDDIIRETSVRTRRTAWVFSLANPEAAVLQQKFDSAYLRLLTINEVPVPHSLAPHSFIPGFPEQYR